METNTDGEKKIMALKKFQGKFILTKRKQKMLEKTPKARKIVLERKQILKIPGKGD